MIVRVTSLCYADYLQSLVDRAGAGALLHAYTAPMPEVGGGAVGAAVRLGTVTLGDPLGTVDAEALTITLSAATPDLLVDADGQVAWLRLVSAAGAWLLDCDVTRADAAVPGAATMPDTQIYAGGSLSLASAVLSL